MSPRSIQAARRPVNSTLRAVPSKSVTHRALVAAALASGVSDVTGPLEADDTRRTLEALEALGFRVTPGESAWRVEGLGGRVPGGGEIRLGESGTSFRLLTAVAALGERPTRLDGAPRLRERPIAELVAVLRRLGGRLETTGEGLPLVAGGGRLSGGPVSMSARRSSQFASALLLIGARLPGGLDLSLEPPVVSLPYVDLTEKVLREFGVCVGRPEPLRRTVREGDYAGMRYAVEGDHSSASYPLAAAAVVGGRIRVEGIDPRSPQPDGRLGGILETLGCTVSRGSDWVEVEGSGKIPAFRISMAEAPDLVPTLAILALFADGECAIQDVPHLRLKESDRLEMVARNLRRLGRGARATYDGLFVEAPAGGPLHGALVETASDHRIAMAFAVAGLGIDGVFVDDPDCVNKSNPRFWEDLAQLEG